MSIDPIPPEVNAFLVADVRSLVSLELLLLLFANRSRAWAVADLARELRSDTEWTRAEIERLRARGLVAPDMHDASLHRCGPLSPQTERVFDWLASGYPARRFSIIQSIYGADSGPHPGPPATQIQSFADAFKLRKEPDRG